MKCENFRDPHEHDLRCRDHHDDRRGVANRWSDDLVTNIQRQHFPEVPEATLNWRTVLDPSSEPPEHKKDQNGSHDLQDHILGPSPREHGAHRDQADREQTGAIPRLDRLVRDEMDPYPLPNLQKAQAARLNPELEGDKTSHVSKASATIYAVSSQIVNS